MHRLVIVSLVLAALFAAELHGADFCPDCALRLARRPDGSQFQDAMCSRATMEPAMAGTASWSRT